MRINQNIAAFNAYRNLSTTQGQLGKSLEKLSSGYRINRAADDAAGLAKSESLRAQIAGTRVAVRNAQDGVSFVQTAEGALVEVHSILQRMRELAVSAANTATSDGTAEQAEFAQLRTEITNIASRTKFASETVFANHTTTTFHIGAGATDNVAIGADLRMALDMLGERVDLVHVKNIRWEQTPAGRWRWRFDELADGQCDWVEVIAALRASGYDGWLSLENLWRVPVRHTGYVDEDLADASLPPRDIDQRLQGELAFLRRLCG
jgi:hypothetical protein